MEDQSNRDACGLREKRIELGELESHVRTCMAGEAEDMAVAVVVPRGDKEKALLALFVQALGRERAVRVFLPVDGARTQKQKQKQSEQRPSVVAPDVSFTAHELEMAGLRTSRGIGRGRGPKQPPTGETERAMQRLWARVLQLEEATIGRDDSFFRLGGDSIAAMRLVGEARREGLKLAVADVVGRPRLQDLAAAAVECEPEVIPRGDSLDGAVEQSFAQGRLWFLEELHPGLGWYLMPLALRIKGPLQLDALHTALQAVEQRHETLRTTFSNEGGKSMQTVHPFCPKDMNLIELGAGDDQALADAMQRDHTTPFDLRTEPGWRVKVYRVGDDHHVLSMTMHHIVSDGWSVDVLMRELAVFYAAALRNQDPLAQVQPLPMHYRDYALWQRQQAQLDEHQRQLGYWLQQLQTSRPAELPCDKPRPATLSGRADVRSLSINGALYARLQSFCKARGTTLFVVLLAVFRATHFRLTGQDDATIGTANANRHRGEVEDLIGFFVNLQCLRTTVAADTSFDQLVHHVHDVASASMANQDVPFDRIVSKLGGDRDLSRLPLVQLVFVVHSQQELFQLMIEGVETERVEGPISSRFDLECHFYQEKDALLGNVLFSTDLYAPATIENMLAIFHTVLDHCLREPTAVVASLPLMTDASLSQLNDMGLVRIQETAYPRDASIVDLFREQVCAHQDRVAVKGDSSGMTYAELDRASDAVARWLTTLSLAPQTLVGVFASRSCETIAALLGILKADLAYLPFDVNTPASRITAILTSLPKQEWTILLGSDHQPPTVQLDGVNFVPITQAIANLEVSAIMPECSPSATSLAYVMFTSGSTGTPKGVMVEHRSIVRLVRDNNLVQYLPTSPVMAHMANLAFDASTWEIFAALLNGGTLVCISRMAVLEPEMVLHTFRKHNVKTAFMTTALMKTYTAEAPAVIAALNMVCVGGEALYPHDLATANALLAGDFINVYGPTENTTFSTFFVCPKNEDFTNIIPIGRAISNSGTHVVDSQLRPVPLGVIGELVLTGDGIARGYTDPVRNINRFVSVKVAGHSVRAYRTGDYVRYRPIDGSLEFFGRIDGQVKIRGHRVELGEIEHVLRSHESVADAVAVLQQFEGADIGLAGFVTISDNNLTTSDQPGHNDDSQHVDDWEEQFDADIYSPISTLQSDTIGRDFIGWTSMYDGSEIDKAEMNEWLDDTIKTMLNGGSAGRVLEIGSGTGMILFNLGNGLQSYVGLDPSQKAIAFTAATAKSVPELADKVRMHKATAAEVGRIGQSIAADLVVLNSVVQYFPSQDYLFDIIEQSLKLNGVRTIFLGDVRSYALHREFLATRAQRMVGSRATKAELQRMMAAMEHVEHELLVDPAFFTGLPDRLPGRIAHVEILAKKMKATNELSCYRYAAVIHVQAQHGMQQDQQQQPHGVKHEDWVDFVAHKLDHQLLLERLQNTSGAATLQISNIPHSKTAMGRCLLASLDDAIADKPDQQDWIPRVTEHAQQIPAMSAVDLEEVAEEAGFRVEISWNRQHSQHGGLDAIFHRFPRKRGTERTMFRFPTDHAERSLHSLTSRPLRHQLLQRVEQELHALLEAQLPAYMVPKTITPLDAMPINQNGKIDRKLLSQQHRKAPTAHGEPSQPHLTATETAMQQLWARVLSISSDRIRSDDNFFRLGGDSIKAMKLVSEARRAGRELSVADIFRNPTLSSLAALDNSYLSIGDKTIPPFSLLGEGIDIPSVREDAAALCSIDASLIEDIYPCSPLQEGLMSLSSKREGDYIMQSVLELRSDIELDNLRTAWEKVVRSTAVLRTRIIQNSTLGLLQAVVKAGISWNQAQELEEYLKEDKSSPMGLGDPLVRFAVVAGGAGAKRWLVWTIHHALYDGWTLPRIWNDVATAYSKGVVAPRPSFNAFIRYLGQRNHKEAEVYWQKSLNECRATPFPSLPHATQRSVADQIIHYQCPRPLKASSDTTTSILVRAAWAVTISRFTQSDDVVFGTTVTGRSAPVDRIEAMVGPTIATVPMRIGMNGAERITAFLHRLQQQATEMIQYEQTGLHQIARMGADAKHACNFQTLLVVQTDDDSLGDSRKLGNWQSSSSLQDFTTYALTLQFTVAPQGIAVVASFGSHVIEQWQITKLLDQFSLVVQQLAVASNQMVIADIDVLTDEDRQLLWAWNRNVPQAVERCIHDLFMEQARAQPRGTAICAWDGELTYRELDDLSSILAGHLSKHELVEPQANVALCFEKSMWTVVAMLAVLKVGGAFVPLDPDHPSSQHEKVLQQIKAKVVLTSAHCPTFSAGEQRTVIVVSEEAMQRMSDAFIPSSVPCQPNDAAYIIFTSGSTGIPKGVVLEHQAVSTSCLGHGSAFGFTPKTRTLQFSTYTFDASIAEIFTTLLHGGCICVPSDSDRRDRLSDVIKTMGVNWAFLTPAVARLLDHEELPPLQLLAIGGEQIRSSDFERWRDHVQAIHVYGPTECCVFCTCSFETGYGNPSVIGKSISSVSWVVDAANHDRLTPVGSTGQLLVEGPILARGYLDDPEKTAAAFINDPTWLVRGSDKFPGRRGRLYKTGDLVRYDGNGNLIYVGRKDNQIKIRGQRVELGEIEHHVRECVPLAHQVAVEVILPGGEKDNATLAAFLQLDMEQRGNLGVDLVATNSSPAQTIFLHNVDAMMVERVPGHMVPSVYFALSQLPMTDSGKTNRKRLREIGASFSAEQLAELRTRSRRPKRQPDTEAEKIMQQLWAQVLNLQPETISIDDSFFHLGGDSITAMKLAAEARKQDIHLKVSNLFRSPTLSGLARQLQPRRELLREEAVPFSLVSPAPKSQILATITGTLPDVDPRSIIDITPATYMQSLYVTHGSQYPTQAFNYFWLDMGSTVDAQHLETSCRRLCDLIPVLRTRFTFVDGEVWQLVLQCLDFKLHIFDGKGAISDVSHTFCMQDAEASSPLAHPTSFSLIRNDLSDHQLVLRLSHAQYDGICLPIILEMLLAIYYKKPLNPATSFQAFVADAQRRRPASLQYWSKLLKDSRITRITPILRPKLLKEIPLSQCSVKGEVNMPQLPGSFTTATLVSCAWATVLSEFSGEEDVVYGHVVAGRTSDLPAVADVIGPCLNIIPVRATVRPHTKPLSLLRAVQEQHLSLEGSDSVGLQDLVENCTADWEPSGTLDSVLQYQNVDENPTLEVAGSCTKVGWFEHPDWIPPYLAIMAYPRGEKLEFAICGTTHTLTSEGASRLLEMLCQTTLRLAKEVQV